MKPIQVMMDEALLRRFDADEEVQRDGRSAVLRRAVAEYLKRRRAAEVSSAYRRAYSGNDALRGEFERWTDEGVWPDE
jgi:metal-responsive CopG/Arc/MetJ family transcriptional regulator